MSGYISLNRTGFPAFDDVLSLIEDAGSSYHHTSQWIDEGWNGEKPFIDQINESISFAADKFLDFSDKLATLQNELSEGQRLWMVRQTKAEEQLTALRTENERLKAELAKCREDAERLDFLADTEAQINWLTCGGETRYQLVWPLTDEVQKEWFTSARAAIDAARKEQSPVVITPPEETKFCSYPKCNCPFDAPADPNWCARGLPHEAKS